MKIRDSVFILSLLLAAALLLPSTLGSSGAANAQANPCNPQIQRC